MTTLYVVDISDEISLVFSKTEIINNMYTETSEGYETFEHTLFTTMKATGNELITLDKLDEVAEKYVSLMFENVESPDESAYTEQDIINYLLTSAPK